MSGNNIKQKTLLQAWKKLEKPKAALVNFNLIDVDNEDSELVKVLDHTLQNYDDPKNKRPSKYVVSHEVGFNHGECFDGLDTEAIRTWIYPINYTMRQYQYDIVKEALWKNTLVILPTGLGKTFIAAVIMYNFYRWYPGCKIVFMAPTRSLVSQQIEACYAIMGIPHEDMIELTGSASPQERVKAWNVKRVFFLTPQVMMNDLARNACSAKLVKCLVVDEAHKALGNHAYSQVVTELIAHNHDFRILALSATPGSDMKAVYQIITNLRISHIEIRSEDSPEIKQYTHGRLIEKIVVKLDEDLERIQEQFLNIIGEYIKKLVEWRVLNHNDLKSYSKFLLLKLREKFRSNPPRQLSKIQCSFVECYFALTMSLYHAYELLTQHGIRSFHNFLNGVLNGDKSNPRSKAELMKNASFLELMHLLEEKLNFQSLQKLDDCNGCMGNGLLTQLVGHKTSDQSYSSSHPKLLKLREIVLEHFQSFLDKGSPTRVMIFAQYRDSVNEISLMLQQDKPLVKAMSFIGQNVSGNSKKGLTQKDQLRVMKMFRDGGYNTLVSTCVGEEGLDIGEVDLIICYDAHKSPIRLVQRMGRTGRKRSGRIVMLVTEGKEEQIYRQGVSNAQKLCKALSDESKLKPYLYSKNSRMIPFGVTPTCSKVFIKVQNFSFSFGSNLENQASRKSRSAPELIFSVEDEKDFEEQFQVTNSINSTSIYLGNLMFFEEEVKKNSFEQWYLWQSTLQPAFLVSHSTKSLLLSSSVEKLLIPTKSNSDEGTKETKSLCEDEEPLIEEFVKVPETNYDPIMKPDSILTKLTNLDKISNHIVDIKCPPPLVESSIESLICFLEETKNSLYPSSNTRMIISSNKIDSTPTGWNCTPNDSRILNNIEKFEFVIQSEPNTEIAFQNCPQKFSDEYVDDNEPLNDHLTSNAPHFSNGGNNLLLNNSSKLDEKQGPSTLCDQITYPDAKETVSKITEVLSPLDAIDLVSHSRLIESVDADNRGVGISFSMLDDFEDDIKCPILVPEATKSFISKRESSTSGVNFDIGIDLIDDETKTNVVNDVNVSSQLNSSQNTEKQIYKVNFAPGDSLETVVNFNMLTDFMIPAIDNESLVKSRPERQLKPSPTRNKKKSLSLKKHAQNNESGSNLAKLNSRTTCDIESNTQTNFELINLTPIDQINIDDTTKSSFESPDQPHVLGSVPFVSIKKSKMKMQKRSKFLDSQVECADDNSEDDSEEDLDHLDSSFIDDDSEVDEPSMKAIYLNSVRNTAHGLGKYKLQYHKKSIILSQDVHNDSNYIEDSFCVADDFHERRKRKKKNIASKCAKFRRINIEEDSDADSIGSKSPTSLASHQTSSENLDHNQLVPVIEESTFSYSRKYKKLLSSQDTCLENNDVQISNISEDKIKVIVSSKEVSRCSSITSAIRFSHNIEPLVVTTEADYIVSTRMCVLRKTWTDFTMPQHRDQLISNVWQVCEKFERVFIIIEQDISINKGKEVCRSKYFDTTICALSQSNIRILHSTGSVETAHFLAQLASLEKTKGHYIFGTTVPAKQQTYLDFYNNIPGISFVTALKLLHHFPSPQHFIDCSPSVLIKNLHLTEKCAKNVYKFLRQAL